MQKQQDKMIMDPNKLLDSIDNYTTTLNSTSSTTTATDVTDQQHQIRPSTRPFDPLEFLNNHFSSSEQMLVSNLPSLLSAVSDRIDDMDEAISSSIYQQSEKRSVAIGEICQAQSSIVQLSQRVSLVQKKARESERAVLEITRDMKRFDYAKKHLQKTITALKRLHMLMNAVEQLKAACKDRRFREAANLLDAVKLLLRYFEGYTNSIEKIREVRDCVFKLRGELKTVIFEAVKVRALGTAGATPQDTVVTPSVNVASPSPNATLDGEKGDTAKEPPSQNLNFSLSCLADSCLVIDSLGTDVRLSLIEMFCRDQIAPYPKFFAPDASPASAASSKPTFKIIKMDQGSSNGFDNMSSSSGNPTSLDQVERRFAWFRHALRTIEENFENVFPLTWNVQYEFACRFLNMTNNHFIMLLEQGSQCRDKNFQNVTILTKAFQKTILFEKELASWLIRDHHIHFEQPVDGTATAEEKIDAEALEFDEYGNAVTASSAQGIKIKYARQMKEKKKLKKQQNASSTGPNGKDLSSGASDALLQLLHQNPVETKPVPPLLGMASATFDNFMDPYIQLEREQMEEQLKHAVTDTTVDTRGELPVFTSSTTLFVYIKNSITRCTVMTRGNTFLCLFHSFQDTLKKYSQVLAQKFPPPTAVISIATALNPGSSHSSGTYRIPPGEEVTICHVIDTCEYCADTVEALQELIRDKIHHKYTSQVDMTTEQDEFYDVTAKGLRVLVSGLVHRVDTALRTEMSSQNWSTLDVVGEESSYVRSLHSIIQPFVETVQSLLPSSYFKNFCDKFASNFITLYYTTIIRLKRVSDLATQQLLLDVYNVKTLLLKIPVMQQKKTSSSATPLHNNATTSSIIPPALYTKMVTKEISKIEIFLKLVGTPTEQLTEMFKSYWPNGTSTDLQNVMNLKGMRRNEQQVLLDHMVFYKQQQSTSTTTAVAGASTTSAVADNLQMISDKTSYVADKVNSDLSTMRQKVDDFRKQFR